MSRSKKKSQLFWRIGRLSKAVMLGSALCATGILAAQADGVQPSHFYEIVPKNLCAAGEGSGVRGAGTIFRGDRPNTDALKYLQARGIKTILNLESGTAPDDEQSLITQMGLGLKELRHPMSAGLDVNKLPNGNYDNDSIIAAVAELRRPSDLPIYVHGHSGDNRVGLVIALHRVFDECWSPKNAEAEWNRGEGWMERVMNKPKHKYFELVTGNPSYLAYYQKRLSLLAQQDANPKPAPHPTLPPSPSGNQAPGQPMKEPGGVVGALFSEVGNWYRTAKPVVQHAIQTVGQTSAASSVQQPVLRSSMHGSSLPKEAKGPAQHRVDTVAAFHAQVPSKGELDSFLQNPNPDVQIPEQKMQTATLNSLAQAPILQASSTDACTPMKDGEFRIVTPKTPRGGMLGSNYKLVKSTDPQSGAAVYDAVLNLRFAPKAGEDPQVADQMRARFNQCFAELGPIGGPNGAELKVRLADSRDDGSMPAATPVDVTVSTAPRADRSNTWSIYSTCPTLIHETMHLLGLVDLYPETAIGWKQDSTTGVWSYVAWGASLTSYDCRSTASAGSVMTEQMNEIVYGTKPSYEQLVCACETSSCARQLDTIVGSPESCPAGTDAAVNPILDASEFTLDTDPKAMAFFQKEYGQQLAEGRRLDRWTFESVKKVPATVKTILYPAEFRAITEPGCESDNFLYYSCSKNAYRTSKEHWPAQWRNESGLGCVNVPPQCQGSEWLR